VGLQELTHQRTFFANGNTMFMDAFKAREYPREALDPSFVGFGCSINPPTKSEGDIRGY
jgi:hypothetical protein